MVLKVDPDADEEEVCEETVALIIYGIGKQKASDESRQKQSPIIQDKSKQTKWRERTVRNTGRRLSSLNRTIVQNRPFSQQPF